MSATPTLEVTTAYVGFYKMLTAEEHALFDPRLSSTTREQLAETGDLALSPDAATELVALFSPPCANTSRANTSRRRSC